MKKFYFSFIFLLGLQNYLSAQEVAWQKDIKSSTQDFLSQLSSTIDGQYLLSGSSIQSNKVNTPTLGQPSNNNGYDYHLIKLNQQGILLWEKFFGGKNHDFLTGAVPTQEGGFLLVGTSYSNQALDKKDKSFGGTDAWIIKTDENGEEQWQKTLGTSSDEEAKTAIQTNNLGYIIAGNRLHSKDAFGSSDVWMTQLDKNGKIIKEYILGGKSTDEVEKIIPTKDGGFLVGIYSRSAPIEGWKENNNSTQQNLTTSEITSNTTVPQVERIFIPKQSSYYGDGDYWILKFNSEGKLEWEKTFGGNQDDQIRSLAFTSFGYVIAGQSRSSSSGNKLLSVKEGTDIWVVGLDEHGNDIWQKSYNFGNVDILMSLNTLNNADDSSTKGFLLGGYTQAEEKKQRNDETFWMLYLDKNGNEVWNKYVEGKSKKKQERLVTALLQRDGAYVLAGTSAEELGKENWKVVKLQDQQINDLIEKKDIKVYPNPVKDYCYVEIGVAFSDAEIMVYDMNGRLLQKSKTKNNVTKISTSILPQGNYIITVKTNTNKNLNSKFIKL